MNIIRTLQQVLGTGIAHDAQAGQADFHPVADVDIYELERRREELARLRLALYASVGVGR